MAGKMTGWLQAARLLPLLFLAAGDTGAEGEAMVQARLVEARLNGVSGLIAAFTQTLRSPALPAPLVERGQVYLLRPGKMRWEYRDPPGKLAITDGERTHLYLPEDRQVVVAPVPPRGTGSGIAFLLRPRIDLLEEFTVTWGGRPGAAGKRPLVLTPRIGPASYDRLVLEISDDHLIKSLQVVDPLGGTVTYQFSGIQLVPTLDEDLFRFEPPPGIAVHEVAP